MKLLPSPKDLGHESDALPSRSLTPDTSEYTWEDWRVEVKAKHPIRWKLQKIIDWFSHWPRASHAWYWLRTHTLDRYHLLDLRRSEPENPDGYRWGWRDRDHMLLLSSFLILRDFVEKEKPWKPTFDGYPKDSHSAIQQQIDAYDEIMTLYRWWVRDRFAEYAAFEAASDAAHERWRESPDDQVLAAAMIEADCAQQNRDDEMLLRLLKIRCHLWT